MSGALSAAAREEAPAMERRLKGWTGAKKMALIEMIGHAAKP
jgi:predicted GIY-YIG superfamily endonuclease